MRNKELARRTGIAAIYIPLIFGVILLGRIFFLFLVSIIASIALWELYGLAQKKGFAPSKSYGIVSVLAITIEFYIHGGTWLGYILFIILFGFLLIELFKGKPQSLANVAISFFGVLYLSLFSSFILIRELPIRMGLPYRFGGWIVILIFSTIWICDTGAYLFGAQFGKHPLFPRVSPQKTWEGAFAGFFTGILASIGLRYLLVPSFSIVDCVVIGVIVGVFGQISDLIESLYKRDCGVKDSSNILPGHGGFLDRFDSPLLVGPLVYIYLLMFGH
ncbi:MAG: phosphatidate cytidylyltransferase [bacterium]